MRIRARPSPGKDVRDWGLGLTGSTGQRRGHPARLFHLQATCKRNTLDSLRRQHHIVQPQAGLRAEEHPGVLIDPVKQPGTSGRLKVTILNSSASTIFSDSRKHLGLSNAGTFAASVAGSWNASSRLAAKSQPLQRSQTLQREV